MLPKILISISGRGGEYLPQNIWTSYGTHQGLCLVSIKFSFPKRKAAGLATDLSVDLSATSFYGRGHEKGAKRSTPLCFRTSVQEQPSSSPL
jgi:hypothetical protein